MSDSSNLSRRAAWVRVGQWGGAWLLFWSLLGLFGSIHAGSSNGLPEAGNHVQPQAPHLLERPRVLWGRIWGGGKSAVKPQRADAPVEQPTAVATRPPPDAAAPVSGAGSGAEFFAAAPAGFDDLTLSLIHI